MKSNYKIIYYKRVRGSTEFTSMRDTIGHKKDELYKKSGKNPIINQQIEQLKQLESQIREEEIN